jgi:hypothetical protein
MSSPAKGLLVLMADVDPAIDEDEFNEWYFRVHIPERLSCPGFLTARRFRSVGASPRYLAVYELESEDALHTAEYLALPLSPRKVDLAAPDGEQTARMLTAFQNVSRHVFTEIFEEAHRLSSDDSSSPTTGLR